MQRNPNEMMEAFDPECEITIFYVVLLRKLMIELNQMKPYDSDIIHLIASLANACFSKNINMIAVETHRMENTFLHTTTNNNDAIIPVFTIHPLNYMRILEEKGETYMDLFRKLLYLCTNHDQGTNTTIKYLSSWLLITDKDKYRLAVSEIYGNEP